MLPSPVTLVLCGPSGSGKSTLIKRLIDDYKDIFGFSVSHTSREPRSGEKNGEDYNFASREEMLAMKDDNEFIEVTEYSGNMYGTSKGSVKKVLDTGRICLLDVDINGVKSLKESEIDCKFVFIRPPSIEILEERLRKRGTESDEDIKNRMENVRKEMDYGDNEDNFDKIIVNDDLSSAYQNLKSFIGQYITTHFD